MVGRILPHESSLDSLAKLPEVSVDSSEEFEDENGYMKQYFSTFSNLPLSAVNLTS